MAGDGGDIFGLAGAANLEDLARGVERAQTLAAAMPTYGELLLLLTNREAELQRSLDKAKDDFYSKRQALAAQRRKITDANSKSDLKMVIFGSISAGAAIAILAAIAGASAATCGTAFVLIPLIIIALYLLKKNENIDKGLGKIQDVILPNSLTTAEKQDEQTFTREVVSSYDGKIRDVQTNSETIRNIMTENHAGNNTPLPDDFNFSIINDLIVKEQVLARMVNPLAPSTFVAGSAGAAAAASAVRGHG